MKTLITYKLPSGKVNSKEVDKVLVREFLIQLKKNKCEVLSKEAIK